MPKRYPLRTVLLMIVALAAFGRLWCLTHPPEVPDQTVRTPSEPASPTPPATPPAPPPGPPSLGAPAGAAMDDAEGSLPEADEGSEAIPGEREPEGERSSDGDPPREEAAAPSPSKEDRR